MRRGYKVEMFMMSVVVVFSSLVYLSMSSPALGETQDADVPTQITGKDGAPMVLVPAGEFLMGRSGRKVRYNEEPEHPVYLDAYYIDKYEVTNSQYAKYIADGRGYEPVNWQLVDLSVVGDVPVTGILWESADGYCKWVGKRLPTEAEWEKAARGTDGRIYPWGNDPPTKDLAVFGVSPTQWKGPYSLFPVTSHEQGKSPYGLHHMAGNAFEWVADLYSDDYYYASPVQNPQGPLEGAVNQFGKKLDMRVARGGSAMSQPPVLTTTFRAGWSHIFTPNHGGFRCAISADAVIQARPMRENTP